MHFTLHILDNWSLPCLYSLLVFHDVESKLLCALFAILLSDQLLSLIQALIIQHGIIFLHKCRQIWLLTDQLNRTPFVINEFCCIAQTLVINSSRLLVYLSFLQIFPIRRITTVLIPPRWLVEVRIVGCTYWRREKVLAAFFRLDHD